MIVVPQDGLGDPVIVAAPRNDFETLSQEVSWNAILEHNRSRVESPEGRAVVKCPKRVFEVHQEAQDANEWGIRRLEVDEKATVGWFVTTSGGGHRGRCWIVPYTATMDTAIMVEAAVIGRWRLEFRV